MTVRKNNKSIDKTNAIVNSFRELCDRAMVCNKFDITRATLTDYLTFAKKQGFISKEEISELDKKKPIKNNKIFDNMESSHVGISLDEFKGKYDPKTIIKNGLSKLTKDKIYKTSEFIQIIGLPTNFGSTKLLDMSELEPFHGKCNGQVWWSHPETIEKFKNEMILR